MGRERTIVNLADGDACRGRDDTTITTTATAAAATGPNDEVDRRALLGPPAVVQVIEGAGGALPKDGRVAEGERTVGAGGEAGRVKSSGLRRLVKLELVAGRDVAGSPLGVDQDTVRQAQDQYAFTGASAAALFGLPGRGHWLASSDSAVVYRESVDVDLSDWFSWLNVTPNALLPHQPNRDVTPPLPPGRSEIRGHIGYLELP